MNWKWRNEYTGATGTCTDVERVDMMRDIALRGLQFTELPNHTPATKPVFELPVRLEENEAETLLAENAEPQKARKNRVPQDV